MGLYNSARTLASLWYDNKKKQLQGEGRPETKVDSGGSKNRNYFSDQDITESELRELKEIRESGGVVAHLVRAKALMQFGTGVEIETENPELEEWIVEYFPDLDNLFIELGEDAIWFPSAYGEIVETRGGDFSHLEAVEPWTILPIEDPYGEVVAWEQKIEGEREGEILQKDELVHFPVHKASARDKTGISDVLCAKEEIEQYRANQHAISNAVEMAAFPHNHWIVGSDQMSTITDNELRRVRNIVDDLKSDTQIITGPDVEHDRIEPTKFDFTELTNHDLRKLAIALGVPMDLVSVGEHGLGAGEESKIRMQMFERQARAAQRTLTGQFKSKVLEPVLRDYSPFSPTEEEFDIHLGDPIEEDETKEMINAIGDDLTVNERRQAFDKAPLEGDEGDEFESPGQEEGGDDGGFGILQSRSLQEIPDNAVNIDSPGECDGQVIEGPEGGMYCVPDGEDGEGNGSGEDSTDMDASEVTAENIDEYFEENYDGVNINEGNGYKTVDFDTFPGVDYPIKSSILVENESGTIETGAARFGEIDPEDIGSETITGPEIQSAWENMADEVGITDHEQVTVDTGDFDDTILHMRVQELPESERVEINDFMEDFEELRTVVAGVTAGSEEQVQQRLIEFESGLGVEPGTMREIKRDGEAMLSGESVEMSLSGGPNPRVPGGDSGNSNSEAQLEQYPEWERSLMELHSRVHHEGTDRALLEFNNSETPEFVKNRLRDAILAGEVFIDIESIPSGERMQLQEYLLESLQSDNWSIDGIADQIEQLGATPQEAETIARTEVGHIVNEAREEGYEEQGLVEGETFYWTGSTDDRTTDTCKYLIKGTNADLDNPSAFSGLPRSDGTNPFEGGEPMELDELKDHITNVANADPAFDTQPRTFTPHIQCRKSYTRFVEG